MDVAPAYSLSRFRPHGLQSRVCQSVVEMLKIAALHTANS
jgi:hypothetical protein